MEIRQNREITGTKSEDEKVQQVLEQSEGDDECKEQESSNVPEGI